jgi:hypothetical protein
MAGLPICTGVHPTQNLPSAQEGMFQIGLLCSKKVLVRLFQAAANHIIGLLFP